MASRQTIITLLAVVVVVASTAQCFSVALLARLSRRARLGFLLGVLAVHGLLLATRPAQLVLSNAVVVASSAAVALALGAGLRDQRSLISFAITASVADIISFAIGPTRALLDRFGGSTGTLVTYLALTLPWQGRRLPVVGIGDLVLLGVFFLAVRQLGFGAAVSWAPPTVGLLVALAVGLLVGGVFGIPFMTAAVIALLIARQRMMLFRRPNQDRAA